MHELCHRADGIYYNPNSPGQDNDYLPDSMDNFPTVMNGFSYPEYYGATAWWGDWEYRARSAEDMAAQASDDWSVLGLQW